MEGGSGNVMGWHSEASHVGIHGNTHSTIVTWYAVGSTTMVADLSPINCREPTIVDLPSCTLLTVVHTNDGP